MPASFSQDCPVCGRCLHIQKSCAQKTVVCQHCQGVFVARDPARPRSANCDWRTPLMKRADELIALASLRLELAISGA